MTISDTADVVANLVSLSERALAGMDSASLYRADYDIAGFVLRVTAASEFLAHKYMSSLNHRRLAVAASSADFDVILLASDLVDARIALDFDEALDKDKPRFIGSWQEEELVSCAVWDENAVHVADLKRKLAICWLYAADYKNQLLPVRPLLNEIHWWLSPRGYQPIHAGAVGNEHGAVLLVGPKGAGKSTLCLQLLAQGMNYFGDDFVLVGPGRQSSDLSVFNLYSWARIKELPHEMRKFAGLWETLIPGETKFSLPLAPFFQRQIGNGALVKAVVCPRLQADAELIKPISSMHAFRSAISTLGHLPGHEKITVRNITSYVTQLPCYSLSVGGDFQCVYKALLGVIN